MKPVPTTSDTEIDYKQKFKTLKRKLKTLVYEHESLVEELEKTQKKLLRVSKDRSFLLDRLLQYEKVDDSSSDSDATDYSDSDMEKTPKKKTNPTEDTSSVNMKTENNSKKKSKSSKKQKLESNADQQKLSLAEIEKHLDSRPSVLSIEKATSSMPSEIFNNDTSMIDSEDMSDTDATDLVIDMK